MQYIAPSAAPILTLAERAGVSPPRHLATTHLPSAGPKQACRHHPNQACRYHPAAPLFHEGSKQWPCCAVKR